VTDIIHVNGGNVQASSDDFSTSTRGAKIDEHATSEKFIRLALFL
jgi:hypothetical protein